MIIPENALLLPIAYSGKYAQNLTDIHVFQYLKLLSVFLSEGF